MYLLNLLVSLFGGREDFQTKKIIKTRHHERNLHHRDNMRLSEPFANFKIYVLG
jgi:hypothetical protein